MQKMKRALLWTLGFVTVPLLAEAPPPLMPIATVQGAGHRSPFEGQNVRVAGVVTAVDRKADAQSGELNVWLQAGVPADDDPATSEAILVRLPAGLVGSCAKVGLGITVEGKVTEWAGGNLDLSVTQLLATSCELGAPTALPAPITLGQGGRRPPNVVIDDDGLASFDAEADALDFYESLEGMRVLVPAPRVTGPTTSRGEIVVLADDGRAAGPLTTRGAVLLRAADDNPDRLLVTGRLLESKMPELAVGTRLGSPVVGILDYGFGQYRILATETIAAASPPDWQPDFAAPAAGGAQLGVATFNVENLSARDPEGRFDAVARLIVDALASPDLLALQEIQDDSGPADDGVVSAELTLSKLVAAIHRVGGPAYAYWQVDPENNRNGGQPGGNIRPAFLYQPQRLERVERPGVSPARLDAAAFFADSARGWVDSRKPLYGQFRFRGHDLFVFAAHLRSKRGDTPLFGNVQPPQRASEPQRCAQAAVLAGLVDLQLEKNPEAAIFVLGDLNDHEFRAPVRILGHSLHNLVEDLPLADRYSYNFQGNAQVLDHILVSPFLRRLGAAFDVIHVNADLPASQQTSDHDPSLVRIEFP